mmetsp:Transcript_5746/g.9248  ORF Transcript_5746/g.9248 Transcript_5746/m.9248 type:complete len:195 (+) Transcript_5746:25-609(+)|eukprot:CAMPEP_0202695644 /NCGR_PEP_ID=MMETSP1385-20130828/9196_1 /ASSEMBLY_ACC=CAM_ASM_000861 /TAXON_ID=933848 /ORGANISM="Elphidium margaritaceum" /LENGTH=194 /DNA_ID=CAMNT_0049351715 /DNA_START=25 /DNA_END=609 /DNA_ORIENTATION=+
MAYNPQQSSGFTCFLCDQPFAESQAPTWERWMKVDENRRAHHECFKCDLCKQAITGKYHEKENGSFYCTDNGCVKKMFGQDSKIVSWNEKQKDATQQNNDMRFCLICSAKLTSSYMVDADNNKYHKECFKCMGCNQQLSDSYIRDGAKLWCKGCRIAMKTKEMQEINAQKNGTLSSNDNFQQSNNQSPFGVKPQ